MTNSGAAKRWEGPIYWKGGTHHRDLLRFTSQFAEVVRAGVPLSEGLRMAAADAPGFRLRNVMLAVHEGVALGESLSQSMARLPNFFPAYYTDLIRVGEQTASLFTILDELEEGLIQGSILRSQASSEIIYLTVGGLAYLVLAAGLLTFVVPRYAEIFESFGENLPPITRSLIGLSEFASGWSGLLLWGALLGAIFIGVVGQGNHPIMKKLKPVIQLLSRLPIISGIVSKRSLSLAAFALEKMLTVGMPLDIALENAAEEPISGRYAPTFKRLAEKVKQGESLSSAMATEGKALPSSFRALTALGESSGLLPQALDRIAHSYRTESLRASKTVMSIFGPVAVCILGLIVFYVYTGLFAPIVGLSSLVS